MAQSQYNFKIEDELKEEAELLSQDFASKQEFLTTLIDSYKTCKNNSVEPDIDMAKYEDIDIKTKSMLSDTFKHIIYTMQQNTSSTKQHLLSVEQDKKSIAEERENFNKQIETIKAEANQDLLDAQKLHKLELEAKDIQITKISELQKDKDMQLVDLQAKVKEYQEELEQVKLIAQQVKTIIHENTQLRKELADINTSTRIVADATTLKIKELTDLLVEKEKETYRADMTHENINKTIETLKQDIEIQKVAIVEKNNELKNLEKENIILATKLEMVEKKENLKIIGLS